MNGIYTPSEIRADALIHVVGVGAAMLGAAWLVQRLSAGPPALTFALGFYATGLVGMTVASAAYNLTTGPAKEWLRRFDHAMIFVMIAATYAPFVTLRLPPETAIPLGVAVGGGCAGGVVMKAFFPRRFDRFSILLYLGMGWAVAWAMEPLKACIGPRTLDLLVLGGIFYTVGVAFCLMERVRFHNALWHACVLGGAGTHFATMVVEFT
ncbi:MAG: PAQR family membrane homeostasis protein TrhA [Solirubrobacterales bacterium]